MKSTTKALTTAVISICVLVLMAFAISFTTVQKKMAPTMRKSNPSYPSCVSIWEPRTGKSTLSYWGRNSSRITVYKLNNDTVVLYLKSDMKDLKAYTTSVNKTRHVGETSAKVEGVDYLGKGLYEVRIAPNGNTDFWLNVGYVSDIGEEENTLAFKTSIKVNVE